MKSTVKIVYIFLSFLFLIYLFLPNPDFPPQLPDSLQSSEPGDTETLLRRAYYTDYLRSEVLKHYQENFEKLGFLNLKFLTYRLNYPPEEAQTLIRDQTRSTFLEEIVHPFRESLFVNGFEPKLDKDAIYVEGKKWNQKITVKIVYSSLAARVFVGLTTVFLTAFIFRKFFYQLNLLIKEIRNLWT